MMLALSISTGSVLLSENDAADIAPVLSLDEMLISDIDDMLIEDIDTTLI